MATTKIPVWIRSEYVTIVSPPFIRSGGQKAPLIWSGELTACRLSVAPLSAYHTIRQNATRPSGFHKGGFYVQICSGILKTLNKREFLLLLCYLSFLRLIQTAIRKTRICGGKTCYEFRGFKNRLCYQAKERYSFYFSFYCDLAFGDDGTILRFTDSYQEFANILLYRTTIAFSILMSKLLKIQFQDKSNPLNNLGILFSINQILYLLIAMWIYPTVPEKMLMVIAMIFGAHLLPYSWLYKSKTYMIMSVLIPIASLIVGCNSTRLILALMMLVFEIIFTALLIIENRKI